MTSRLLRSLWSISLLSIVSTILAAGPAAGQTLPCAPCGGLIAGSAAEAEGLAGELGAVTEFAAGTPVFVAWEAALDGKGAAEAGRAAGAVRGVGATPWVRLVFSTPPPLAENAARLAAEVAAASGVARGAGDAWYQVDWRPEEAEGVPAAAEGRSW